MKNEPVNAPKTTVSGTTSDPEEAPVIADQGAKIAERFFTFFAGAIEQVCSRL
jgi:hypothetical protein